MPCHPASRQDASCVTRAPSAPQSSLQRPGHRSFRLAQILPRSDCPGHGGAKGIRQTNGAGRDGGRGQAAHGPRNVTPCRPPPTQHSPVGQVTDTPPPAALRGHPRGCPGPCSADRGCAGPAGSPPAPAHWPFLAEAPGVHRRPGPFTSNLPGSVGGGGRQKAKPLLLL